MSSSSIRRRSLDLLDWADRRRAHLSVAAIVALFAIGGFVEHTWMTP